MRISNGKPKIVFVICPNPDENGNACPRITLTRSSTVFRDDYRGKIKMGKGLLKRL